MMSFKEITTIIISIMIILPISIYSMIFTNINWFLIIFLSLIIEYILTNVMLKVLYYERKTIVVYEKITFVKPKNQAKSKNQIKSKNIFYSKDNYKRGKNGEPILGTNFL